MGLRAPRIVRWMHPLIPGVGMLLGHTVQTIWFPGNIAAIILCVPVSFVVMWIGMAYLGKWIWRPHVNQALREMGYDVCGWCGYWLRGLSSSIIKCPECGAVRVSTAKNEHPS